MSDREMYAVYKIYFLGKSYLKMEWYPGIFGILVTVDIYDVRLFM